MKEGFARCPVEVLREHRAPAGRVAQAVQCVRQPLCDCDHESIHRRVPLLACPAVPAGNRDSPASEHRNGKNGTAPLSTKEHCWTSQQWHPAMPNLLPQIVFHSNPSVFESSVTLVARDRSRSRPPNMGGQGNVAPVCPLWRSAWQSRVVAEEWQRRCPHFVEQFPRAVSIAPAADLIPVEALALNRDDAAHPRRPLGCSAKAPTAVS